MQYSNLADELLKSPVISRSVDIAPARYPDDTAEFVFMKRALDELAKAKFGEKWGGEEPFAQLPEPLPDAFKPTPVNALMPRTSSNDDCIAAEWIDTPARSILERADLVLAIHRPDLQRPWRYNALFNMSAERRPISFTLLEWKIAQAIIVDERETSLEKLRRWWDLQKAFVQCCVSGDLNTALRDVRGGAYLTVPAENWITEAYSSRFTTFTMHPEFPFEMRATGMQWIFVEKRLLDKLVAKLTRIAESSCDRHPAKIYKSEAQRHMEFVSGKLGISGDRPLNKEEVKQHIIDLWPGPDRLSEAEAGYMATFIRPRSAKAGKNQPKS